MADTHSRSFSAIDDAVQGRPPGGALPWVLVILAVYVGFWAFTRNLTHYNLDRHGDMVENFAWGIAWQLGYQKHPPLFGWITAAWFTVLPRTNAAYFLLSSVNVASAAFTMWLISRRYLTEWQQIIAVLLIFLLPPLSFHAMVYNASSAMLPFWALGFLFYLRTIERRRWFDACLTGVFCGLAVLAKYHAAVLVVTLAAHAVFDRETRPLLRTALPWVAMASGALVLAPHVWWIVQSGFVTIAYAAEQGDGTFMTALLSAGGFLGAFVLFAVPGIIVGLLHWRPRNGFAFLAVPPGWRAFASTMQGRALLFAGPGAIVLTVALALPLSAQLSSLWVMPIYSTVPIFLAALVAPANAARYWHAAPVTTLVFCAVLLAVSPMLRSNSLERAESNSALPIADLASEVQSIWREETGSRLAIVVSNDQFLANGTSFYASDTPYAVYGNLDVSPWVTMADIERQGAVYICKRPSGSPCGPIARRSLGAVDARIPVSVPAVEGAGGPRQWGYVLFLRYPAAAKSRVAEFSRKPDALVQGALADVWRRDGRDLDPLA